MSNKNLELKQIISEAVDEMMDGKTDEELNELFAGLGALGRAFGGGFKKAATDVATTTANKVKSVAKTMGADKDLEKQEAAMADAFRLAKSMKETLTTKMVNDRSKFGEFQVVNMGKGNSTEETFDNALQVVNGGLKTMMNMLRIEIQARRSKLSYAKTSPTVDKETSFGDKLTGAMDRFPMGQRPSGGGVLEAKKGTK